MKIQTLITDTRKRLHETQKEFGKRFGLDESTICLYESGDREARYKVIEFCFDFLENWIECPRCKGEGWVKKE